MNTTRLLALCSLFLAPSVLAAVPMEMPLQGVVRDNAGNPANGEARRERMRRFSTGAARKAVCRGKALEGERDWRRSAWNRRPRTSG